MVFTFPRRRLNDLFGVMKLREEFYGRIASQVDQTEWLVHILRENRDSVTGKFNYYLDKASCRVVCGAAKNMQASGERGGHQLASW